MSESLKLPHWATTMCRLLGAIAALTCSLTAASAPIPDLPPDPVYFPTKVGTRWVCRISGNPGWDPYEHEFTVSVTEAKSGATHVTTRRVVEGKKASGDRMTLTKVEVLNHGTLRDAFEPPLPVLKHPLRAGQSWTWKGTYTSQPRTQTRTIKGVERVKVPAGKFDAVHIEVVEVRNQEDLTRVSTEWHVAGIGCVKWVSYNLSEEMLSFTPAR